MLLALVITSYAVSACAELAGIVLVVLEARSSERALVQYLTSTRIPGDTVKDLLRRRSVVSAHYRQDADDLAVTHMLRSRSRWGLAVGLLLAGTLTGAVGNFASLGLGQ